MNKDRIMNRLQQHLDAVRESGQDWLGIFLQGSQNYGLDYESSDIFTPYYILNPIYADLFQPIWDAREDIARYNNYAGMSCLLGMALEKQKAMEHPYPATIDKIERFGYDPKQLHHALRMREFMTRYMADEKYSDCLVSKQADYLVEVKRVIIAATMMLVLLVGCAESNEYLEQQCNELRTEIAVLKEQKSAIEAEIVSAKEENGTATYVVTFRIKQSHFTLDIGEHLKDSMNEITFEVPVDKAYYDSVSVGDTINDDFRMGSLIMHGSFGNWKVTIEKKEVQ